MKAYLEPEEVAMMEKAAGNLRDRLLIRILFYRGCRISEVLALEVKDVDFAKGTITILHLKHRVDLSCTSCGARLSLCHVFCPKCGGKTNDNA